MPQLLCGLSSESRESKLCDNDITLNDAEEEEGQGLLRYGVDIHPPRRPNRAVVAG
jgi:hypothetical protein